ncbi:hypothetical protein ACFVAJ_03380 [Agromyces sp. NPDC057679]|uniref:hypothetical protein n=1 Tax=Agromyces sp. NPDC057679 TaxID=3346207 RepID=UPI0036732FBD
MDTETEDSRTEPAASRATAPLTTGILAAAVYFLANPLIYWVPLVDWLPPGPSSGIFAYVTLPMFLCIASAVLGVVAIVTGRSALRQTTARARAGAGLALGVAAAVQAVIYLVLIGIDFAAM